MRKHVTPSAMLWTYTFWKSWYIQRSNCRSSNQTDSQRLEHTHSCCAQHISLYRRTHTVIIGQLDIHEWTRLGIVYQHSVMASLSYNPTLCSWDMTRSKQRCTTLELCVESLSFIMTKRVLAVKFTPQALLICQVQQVVKQLRTVWALCWQLVIHYDMHTHTRPVHTHTHMNHHDLWRCTFLADNHELPLPPSTHSSVKKDGVCPCEGNLGQGYAVRLFVLWNLT